MFWYKVKKYSFSAEVGSRGYRVYRNTSWNQIYVNQAVAAHKEKNIVSLQIDPYCCAITITRVDKIGPVTVGHIPREISRFVYFFLHEQGAISGTVVDTEPRISPIPEGDLEIKLLLNFTHPVERILNRMKELVVKQLLQNRTKTKKKKQMKNNVFLILCLIRMYLNQMLRKK